MLRHAGIFVIVFGSERLPMSPDTATIRFFKLVLPARSHAIYIISVIAVPFYSPFSGKLSEGGVLLD